MANPIIGSLGSITDQLNPVKAFNKYTDDVSKTATDLGYGAGAARAAMPFALKAMGSLAGGPIGLGIGALSMLPYTPVSPYEVDKDEYGNAIPVTDVEYGKNKTMMSNPFGISSAIFDTKDALGMRLGPEGTEINVTTPAGGYATGRIGKDEKSILYDDQPWLNDLSRQEQITMLNEDAELDQADADAGDGGDSGGGFSVICTEIYRQGLMPKEWYLVDQKVGQRYWHEDPDVIIGYHAWGIPIAKMMKKSKIITFLAKGLALTWAKEMYAQECDIKLSTKSGRFLCNYGPKLCKFIGKKKSWLEQE